MIGNYLIVIRFLNKDTKRDNADSNGIQANLFALVTIAQRRWVKNVTSGGPRNSFIWNYCSFIEPLLSSQYSHEPVTLVPEDLNPLLGPKGTFTHMVHIHKQELIMFWGYFWVDLALDSVFQSMGMFTYSAEIPVYLLWFYSKLKLLPILT